MSEERRGRPSETPAPIKEKWEMVVEQYPSKPELGHIMQLKLHILKELNIINTNLKKVNHTESYL